MGALSLLRYLRLALAFEIWASSFHQNDLNYLCSLLIIIFMWLSKKRNLIYKWLKYSVNSKFRKEINERTIKIFKLANLHYFEIDPILDLSWVRANKLVNWHEKLICISSSCALNHWNALKLLWLECFFLKYMQVPLHLRLFLHL